MKGHFRRRFDEIYGKQNNDAIATYDILGKMNTRTGVQVIQKD